MGYVEGLQTESAPTHRSDSHRKPPTNVLARIGGSTASYPPNPLVFSIIARTSSPAPLLSSDATIFSFRWHSEKR